tara:strand:- start:526 stop:954 length:429 start_codon:yes stop_codon:yes gene_type:complete
MKHLFEEKTNYDTLTGKEQEVYNFAKTASTLADYGFSCNLITADKHGADMIAYHIESGENMNIQLKGSRATLNKKYKGRNLWISYIDRKTNEVCLYNHDDAVEIFEKTPSAQTDSWLGEKAQYSGMTLHNHFNHIIIRKPIS